MKTLFLILLLSSSTISFAQKKPVEKWVDEIVKDMIDLTDLGKYSKDEIPSAATVNFIKVESVKDIVIDQNIIRMLVNHGKGTYCTELKFKYIEENGKFFLVFAAPETKVIFGNEAVFVNPWIEKNKVCD